MTRLLRFTGLESCPNVKEGVGAEQRRIRLTVVLAYRIANPFANSRISGRSSTVEVTLERSCARKASSQRLESYIDLSSCLVLLCFDNLSYYGLQSLLSRCWTGFFLPPALLSGVDCSPT